MLNPVFGVNKSSSEVSALIRPCFDTLDNLGVKYVTATNTYSGYLAGYNTLMFLKHFTVADILVDRDPTIMRLGYATQMSDRESPGRLSRS
jgi:hypothetical protein